MPIMGALSHYEFCRFIYTIMAAPKQEQPPKKHQTLSLIRRKLLCLTLMN